MVQNLASTAVPSPHEIAHRATIRPPCVAVRRLWHGGPFRQHGGPFRQHGPAETPRNHNLTARLTLSIGSPTAKTDCMLHHVVTMEEAIALGVSRRKVYRLLEKGLWLRLHEGVFLTEPALKDVDRWHAELAGHLLFGGPGSFVSHRSAARLHRLEGITGFPVESTVIESSRHHPVGAHTTIHCDAEAVVIQDLSTSSITRTIRDLAQKVPAATLEQAIESALRGSDPRRPDIWNHELLARLRACVLENPRRRGNFVLATVLARRSDDDRPCGSYPEMLLFQALRELCLLAIRQPSFEIVDPTGSRPDRFFPDLVLLAFRLIIEVDGAEAHANPTALQRDLVRQNKLRGFRLLRFTATDVLRSPHGVARQIKRYVDALTPLPANCTGWSTEGVDVSYTTNRFVIVDAAPARHSS
jgi:very-short-patch-repair endonuclease